MELCDDCQVTGTSVAPTVDSKRNALLSALFLPFCEFLRSPFRKTCPSCSILTFGRLSFVDHTHAFFSSGDYSTVLLELAAQYQDVWRRIYKLQSAAYIQTLPCLLSTAL